MNVNGAPIASATPRSTSRWAPWFRGGVRQPILPRYARTSGQRVNTLYLAGQFTILDGQVHYAAAIDLHDGHAAPLRADPYAAAYAIERWGTRSGSRAFARLHP